jgi:putative membrane protein
MPRVWTPYCGEGPAPAELWLRWNLDPALLAVLGLAVLASYRLWREPGARPALFGLAIVSLAVSFVSPLCALSSALFAARVTHHVLLVAVAAPLLVWAAPRRRLPALSLPAATLLHAALFWLWHAPGTYAAALSSDALYWVMQASLLGSATVFWAAVRRATAPTAAAALLVATVQMGLLGALLTFASSPLYAPHLLTTSAWGLTSLEDQQLGGLIMWAPAAGLYLLAALSVVWRAIGAEPKAVAA